jgi:hypothetical protein
MSFHHVKQRLCSWFTDTFLLSLATGISTVLDSGAGAMQLPLALVYGRFSGL